MKNFLKNHKFAAPSIAALVVVALSVSNVLAQPSSTPTGGNVDARFSTLGTGVLGSETFFVDTNGDISNPSNNPVNFVNTKGIISTTTSGSDAAITGNGGWTGIIGNSTSAGSGYGVYGQSSGNNTIAVFGQSTGNSAHGVYGQATGAFGAGVIGEATNYYGVYGTGGTAGGYFSTPTLTNSVTLGTSTAAVNAAGVIKNANLTIAANGTVSNPQTVVTSQAACDAMGGYYAVGTCYPPVKFGSGVDFSGVSGLWNTYANNGVIIQDTDGLDVRSRIGNYSSGIVPLKLADNDGVQFTNFAGAAGLAIEADGDILNPSGSNPVVVNDAHGFALKDGSSNPVLTISKDAYLTFQKTDTSVFPYGVMNMSIPSGLAVSPHSSIAASNPALGGGNIFASATVSSIQKDHGGNIIAKGGNLDGGSISATRGVGATSGGNVSAQGNLSVSGTASISGNTNLYGNLYTNGNDIWGFSGTNIYAGGYINAGNYITANDIGDFEYDSNTYTLSPLQRFTNCIFGPGSAYGAYFTTIAGGYRLTAGSPVKVEASYPADLYGYGEPSHWCVTYYNPSGTTSYTTYTYALDWSPSLPPGSY